ncbi:ExeM/NucH family extracellular endonuclease [Candidatus Albibeggiatoa sp. nov. BB20]|uniref:ExeM/NucH family extracellular endonuclease n=1 Tax=Candidatus Albibeggiatoa sp. nov. BB20 TaxID=3162723 RepID=UPI0033655190
MSYLIKRVLMLGICIIFFSGSHANAALNAGDIAFVAYNAVNLDNFSFVALVDIAADEEIKFTDNGWKSDNTWRTGEGIITWTAPVGGIATSRVITITTMPSASEGSVTEYRNLNFAVTGDQIIAYQNTDTMIAALNNEGSAVWQADATNTNTSALPQGLTNGTNAVVLNEIDNATYTGTITGDKTTLRAAINNNANWTGSDNTNLTFLNQVSCDRSAPVTHCIHTIQGSDVTSPLDGMTVTIEGIVVGDFQYSDVDEVRNLGGFFVQEEDSDIDEDTNTSEGIFVYDGNSPIDDMDIGDKVRVTAEVREYFGITELIDPTIVVINKGNTLPIVTNIDLPLSSTVFNDDSELIGNLEQYEGMLVTFNDTLTVNELYNLDRFGEFVASEGGRLSQFTQSNAPDITAYSTHLLDVATRSIMIDDGRFTQNNIPIYPDDELDIFDVFRMGDTVANLKGVIHYSRGSGNYGKQTYRLHPTENPSFTHINTRPSSPENVGGTLKAASINVHNYFTTLNERGADTSSELIRQTDKLIRLLDTLEADIIGLTELENNYQGGNSAAKYLTDELNARVGAGTYTYADAGEDIGDDDIAVGILFKSAVFQQAASTSIQVLDDSDLPTLGMSEPIFNGSGSNRSPLAMTFTHKATDETFTFVVAHMKSKSSAGNYPDDDDSNDGQGYSNQTRLLGVQALKAWLATDPTNSDDDDFLIVGDFNAYVKEDPVIEMEQTYTNLIGVNNYSYVYDGQKGALDYAFASPTLNTQVTGSTIWHTNADEPDAFDYDENFNDITLFDPTTPYRASDHDPVVIGLSLSSAAEIAVKDREDELITSATVDLGSALINGALTKTLTIENTGNVDLELSSISLTGNFSFSNSVASDITISASSSYEFAIELSNTSSSGNYSGTLSFDSNDTDESSFSINFTGTVINSSNSDNSSDSNSSDDTNSSDNSSDSSSSGDTDSSDNSSHTNSSSSNAAPPAPQPNYHLLSVAGTKAHITSQPSGIDCQYGAGTCSHLFDRGETVQLVLESIDVATGMTQDDYTVIWDGGCGNSTHTMTMYDSYQCLVQVYGKQGIDYSTGSNNTTTGQLNFLNFSGHSLLRGDAEDVILGFILKGEGTTNITLHADILDTGVMPLLDLNEVLFDTNIGWYGQLLSREQHANSFTQNRIINPGIYTIQLGSMGTKGRGMAGISLKNNQLNLTNLSVRGYLQDALALNFIVDGEGTQQIKVNTRILSGQASTQLFMLNLATSQTVINGTLAKGSIIEIGAGAYAILLNVLSGQGIGMIEVDLLE